MKDLKPIDQMELHPLSEQLVDFLCTRTQSKDRHFFRIMLAYYWGVIASQLHVSIAGFDRKDIPINIYVLNLSPSGNGKGYASNFMESEVIDKFRSIFLDQTFRTAAEINVDKLAKQRVKRNPMSSYDDELAGLEKEFHSLGEILFSFDSATVPAVKQMRQKLLLAQAGSINLQIDEIAANLVGQTEVLNAFLELYDTGKIKDKLVKSTVENLRSERLYGTTPTNMMLFGTPTKLLDGGATENHLVEMLEMGYARRCFFGCVKHSDKVSDLTPEEIFKQMRDTQSSAFIEDLSVHLASLASHNNMHKKVIIEDTEIINLIGYRIFCEQRGREFKPHEVILKSEMDHRYFKVLKLAGAYAFLEQSPNITLEHLEYAIALAEESGKAFAQLMTPERNYERLAKYLANTNNELTYADLDIELPSFRGGINQKNELVNMAIAWGYKQGILIHKIYSGGILFLKGEKLKETSLDELIFSYSEDMTHGYESGTASMQDLVDGLLRSDTTLHWLTHSVTGGHRLEKNVIPGFNMITLDVDDGTPLAFARHVLEDYTYIMYTTKSHTDEHNRYRIILPTNFVLKLDEKTYKEFMKEVCDDLPFEVDEPCNHRCKKWLTNPQGEVFINQGNLFDVLPYIPKTTKAEERAALLADQGNLEALERWVLNNTGEGNRNNQLLKYGLILVDKGMDFAEIFTKVHALNTKLTVPLDGDELSKTVMSSVAKKLTNQEDSK